MLHLFKKVYLETDEKITIEQDRIVISDEHGYALLDALKDNSNGKLIDFSKNFNDIILKHENFVEFMNYISHEQEKTNSPIIIFADRDAFTKIAANWYKLIFKNPSAEESFNFLKSHFFREKLFSGSRFSINKNTVNLIIEKFQFVSEFNSISISPELKNSFLEKHKKFLSIEFLLSSYLFNETCKEELKNRVSVLIRKDLEKYLFELKEILLVHLLRKKFQTLIGATKIYDFSNFYDMIGDKSPIINVFFKPEIWPNEGLSKPSSSGKINFKNISNDDIDNIMKFTEYSGQEWEEENFYRFTKSDMGKMLFVKHLQTDELSDDALKDIIDFEIRGNHAAGSFYSLDIQSVNHYFIDFILNCVRENKKEDISYFIV